ncbi:MAG: hypothetical protein EB025_04110, partial [Chitinophagaceae bacterium]|nr:hypothetical protein [Chitinophagaceae bacterium]
EGKDLDYITRSNVVVKDDLIDCHNRYLETLYGTSADELILNPRNYFYTKGVKFVSLAFIRALKARRNEPKDVEDIKLIDSL